MHPTYHDFSQLYKWLCYYGLTKSASSKFASPIYYSLYLGYSAILFFSRVEPGTGMAWFVYIWFIGLVALTFLGFRLACSISPIFMSSSGVTSSFCYSGALVLRGGIPVCFLDFVLVLASDAANPPRPTCFLLSYLLFGYCYDSRFCYCASFFYSSFFFLSIRSCTGLVTDL